MSRTSSINCRVEPEVARGLTWLTNKYNYENKEAFTKTDIIELLVGAAIKDNDLIDAALAITGKCYDAYEIYLEGSKYKKEAR